MIWFKPGTDLTKLSPQIVLAINNIHALVGDVFITSVSDPAPGRVEGSLHASGCAVDFRFPPRHLWPYLAELFPKEGQYDLVFEKDHIHLEFDPR